MMDYWIALSGGGMSKRDQAVACKLAFLRSLSLRVTEACQFATSQTVSAATCSSLRSTKLIFWFALFSRIHRLVMFHRSSYSCKQLKIVCHTLNPSRLTPNTARVCALFTRPEFFPSKLLETFNFPTVCGAPACERNDCGLWEIKACRTLHPGSEMVRKQAGPGSRVLCNKWGCEVRHVSELGDVNKAMMRCQRCKEALYCSKEHQVMIVRCCFILMHVFSFVIGLCTKSSARRRRLRDSMRTYFYIESTR